ncbi:MAG: SDR family oxidoreductase [Xanthomonadaceae bacterium]|nr:SDR family oxidoreductase [Xanthomonadaceae bacterium]
MQHVLITGGSGFIGSHLCERFLSEGYAVTALDNLVTGQKENIKNVLKHPHFEFIEQDVCDPIDLRSWKNLKAHGLSGVLHFACPASPIDFEKIPFVILKVDSIGTMKTVDLAIEHKARYVLASTSEVYGDPLVHPQTEDYWGNVNPVGVRSCYDEAKRFSEAYVHTARLYSDLNSGIIRIFNTYGPRMRKDDGRVVPELCMQAIQGKTLTIHGDGSQTRSFCFVDDLVDGIYKMFQSKESGPFNLGNPNEFTVKEFAEKVVEYTGSKSKLSFIPARADDPKQRKPDITRVQTKLGWNAKVNLDQGLKKTIEFFNL